jgi:hypothetical protein
MTTVGPSESFNPIPGVRFLRTENEKSPPTESAEAPTLRSWLRVRPRSEGANQPTAPGTTGFIAQRKKAPALTVPGLIKIKTSHCYFQSANLELAHGAVASETIALFRDLVLDFALSTCRS